MLHSQPNYYCSLAKRLLSVGPAFSCSRDMPGTLPPLSLWLILFTLERLSSPRLRYLLGSFLHIIHVCAQRSPLRGNTWLAIKSPHSRLYFFSYHLPLPESFVYLFVVCLFSPTLRTQTPLWPLLAYGFTPAPETVPGTY